LERMVLLFATSIITVSLLLKSTEALKPGKYDAETALSLVQFTAISYCHPENIKAWKCTNCDSDFHKNLQLVENDFQNNYVVDNGKDSIVVVAEGAPPDRMASLKKHTDDDLSEENEFCTGCKVHSGFNDILKLVGTPLSNALKEARNRLPTANVYFTGHGMGAVVSTFLAYKLVKSGEVPADLATVYTFGSPGAGNQEWADAYNKVVPNTWRINSNEDIIIHSSKKKSNYLHVGTIVVCPSRISKDCPFTPTNEEDGMSHVSLADHKMYLGVDVSEYSEYPNHQSPLCGANAPPAPLAPAAAHAPAAASRPSVLKGQV